VCFCTCTFYSIVYKVLKLNDFDYDVDVVNAIDVVRRLLVGSPRDGQLNADGDKQGMLYRCRLHNRLPLNQVCTPYIGR